MLVVRSKMKVYQNVNVSKSNLKTPLHGFRLRERQYRSEHGAQCRVALRSAHDNMLELNKHAYIVASVMW